MPESCSAAAVRRLRLAAQLAQKAATQHAERSRTPFSESCRLAMLTEPAGRGMHCTHDPASWQQACAWHRRHEVPAALCQISWRGVRCCTCVDGGVNLQASHVRHRPCMHRQPAAAQRSLWGQWSPARPDQCYAAAAVSQTRPGLTHPAQCPWLRPHALHHRGLRACPIL